MNEQESLNGKEKKMKFIVKTVDFVLIIGTLVLFLGIIGYAKPYIIAPLDNETFTGTEVLFSFGKANSILIDSTPNFTAPIKYYAEDNLVISLKPGTYYWKVEGALASEVRMFTILSHVDLQLHQNDEGYTVVNAGNVPLDVELYENGSMVSKVVLDVQEERNASIDKTIGGQHAE